MACHKVSFTLKWTEEEKKPGSRGNELVTFLTTAQRSTTLTSTTSSWTLTGFSARREVLVRGSVSITSGPRLSPIPIPIPVSLRLLLVRSFRVPVLDRLALLDVLHRSQKSFLSLFFLPQLLFLLQLNDQQTVKLERGTSNYICSLT